MKKVFKYFKEMKKEISKIKWPTKKEMLKYSIATIFFIIFFAIMFAIIDLIMAALQTWVK
ncbi:MAG: preprotein translocase subunit SecE [Tenericutes bacterium]|jgi:preprotein translocase subunit SecE|nr:preprotein translocase subunit SecE [Mycoplasmatota bacterium]